MGSSGEEAQQRKEEAQAGNSLCCGSEGDGERVLRLAGVEGKGKGAQDRLARIPSAPESSRVRGMGPAGQGCSYSCQHHLGEEMGALQTPAALCPLSL